MAGIQNLISATYYTIIGRTTLITWTEFLLGRDGFVEKGRRVYKTQALIDILYREGNRNNNFGTGAQTPKVKDSEREFKGPHSHPSRTGRVNN